MKIFESGVQVMQGVLGDGLSMGDFRLMERLYEGRDSVIYRAERFNDHKPVIMKCLNREYPALVEVGRFRHEYEMTLKAGGEGVIQVLGFERFGHTYVIIEEDFGGESLGDFLAGCEAGIAEKLSIAVQSAAILGQIHSRQIIHKNINPSNFIYQRNTQVLKIIDFGIAAEFCGGHPAALHPNVMESPLAYMSPEQTGRMNRVLDYRSDFYSLGVMLYYIFTNHLPYETDDPLECAYSHIAKKPPYPGTINPDLPPVLSNIIMKLMAKMAEERYQSALGLKEDLKACLHDIHQYGTIKNFELGQKEVYERFQLSQKLYGRDREIASILRAFNGGTDSRAVFVSVSGYAGVGKSALAHEIQKNVLRKRGYFIEGKFDQLKRDIPYTAIIQAIRKLIRMILSEGKAQVKQWREKNLKGLGINGRIMIEVIPELEWLIGTQPSVPELSAAETQNRFRLVFHDFIRALAADEHPLFIFLDDLQWSDPASLDLLAYLMTDPETRHLFVIGAYRDNEVDEHHPLRKTLSQINQAGILTEKIDLGPLDFSHILQLIADTLHCRTNEVEALADLCLRKTQGNPLFFNQFLIMLYNDNLLEFDPVKGRWAWDIDVIEQLEITDNVVELMVSKLQRLPEATQTVLQLAACIGSVFDLELLAIVREKNLWETFGELEPSIKEGLVISADDSLKYIGSGNWEECGTDSLTLGTEVQSVSAKYQFLHDRVQQAAYSLIQEMHKKAVHWKIGRLLLASLDGEAREDFLFDLLNHFNMSKGLINDSAEKQRLAEMNLSAGRKAKASAAFGVALSYFRYGFSWLAADCWETQYELSLALHTETAEALYLNGDFEEMERVGEVITRHARTLLDQIELTGTKILAYSAQNQPLKAIYTALPVLKQLGVTLPVNPGKLRIFISLLEIRRIFAGKYKEDMLEVPEKHNPEKTAAIKIMTMLGTMAYWGRPELSLLLILKRIAIVLQYGNPREAAPAYTIYGIILCGVLGELEKGYYVGQAACRLLENLNLKEVKARVLFDFNAVVRHWKEPLSSTIEPLVEAYHAGLETGDLECAGISAMIYCCHLFCAGKPLETAENEIKKYHAAIDRIKQKTPLNVIKIFYQSVLNLKHTYPNPIQLKGDVYDEDVMLPRLLAADNITAVCLIYLNKILLGYMFGAYNQAFTYARQAEQYLSGIRSTYGIPVFYFYDALIRLALLKSSPETTRRRLLKKVRENQKKLKKWAKHAPMNHRHKWCLVEAERFRYKGDDLKAMKYYKEAIQLAKDNKYLQEEALSNELCAGFFMDRGDEKIAMVYMKEAYYTYALWGADAKVNDLEHKYPHLLSECLIYGGSFKFHQSSAAEQNAAASGGEVLDLMSIIKIAQVLSSEVDFRNLLKKIMQSLIENAGAECGLLLLEKTENFLSKRKKKLMTKIS